ncbi:MAG: GNAT family N-acetyltransferase [Phycisphaerales bacterium]
MLPTHQPTVSLRPVRAEDLPSLYSFQCDPESARMAMVIPRSRENFDSLWAGILANPSATARAILYDGSLVGSIGTFLSDGHESVGYGIARSHWGRGIATRALALLLAEAKIRPLHARAAVSNAGSHKVLINNGFTMTGTVYEEATERYLACDCACYILT